MPKQPNVTVGQINALTASVRNLTDDIAAIKDEVRDGRVNDIEDVTKIARSFASLASQSASMAAVLLAHDERMALELLEAEFTNRARDKAE